MKENVMEKDVKDWLDNLKPNRELVKIQHRRLFGLGFLACASFVLILGLLLPDTDRAWWIGGGLMILAVGGYHFDCATRELKKKLGARGARGTLAV